MNRDATENSGSNKEEIIFRKPWTKKRESNIRRRDEILTHQKMDFMEPYCIIIVLAEKLVNSCSAVYPIF
jgi:hypothetical protein